MFNKQLPHVLCFNCSAKVARSAYYCKNCGQVVDDVAAPGSKVEDHRFSSKFKFALQRHLIRNVLLLIFFILFTATGLRIGINYLQTVKDNGSSSTYKLTVIAPQDPMTCRGAICHININITNKTNVVQHLSVTPDLVTLQGKKFAPADPARMGNGSNYCQPKLSLSLKPFAVARYVGICAQDIPTGTVMSLAELRDTSGVLIVSGAFKATAY